jgi:hypothetical protein
MSMHDRNPRPWRLVGEPSMGSPGKAALLLLLVLGCSRGAESEGTAAHPWRLFVYKDDAPGAKAEKVLSPYYGTRAKEDCEQSAKGRLELWAASHPPAGVKFQAWCERE